MEKASGKKNLEFFEDWMKLQKEFMDNWTKNQNQFFDSWLEAAKKLQEAFLHFDGGRTAAPGKEMFNMYNTWLETMVNSSRMFTSEAQKMQETWKNSMEKQTSMAKDAFKNFSDISRQEAAR